MLACGCSACGRQSSADNARADQPSSATPSTTVIREGMRPPWFLENPATAAVVFADVSGSMQGFDRRATSVTYAALQRVKIELLTHGIKQYSGIAMGTGIEKETPIFGPEEVLTWPANAPNTCLPKAFSGLRPADERFFVLFTDSVADGAPTVCGSLCGTGNDPACVADAVHRFIQQGRALWLVGFRVPYTVRGKTVDRPVYLWLGGRDVSLGRSVARALSTTLTAAKGKVLALEIWPGGWDGMHSPETSWSSRAFVAPQGCIRPGSESYSLKAIRAGDVPTVVLKGAKDQEQGVWGFALPLIAIPALPPEITPFMTISPAGTGLFTAVASIPKTMLRVDGAYLKGCTSLRKDDELNIVGKWTATPHPLAVMAQWSTNNPKDLTKTQGLQELLAITGALLSNEPITTPLLTAKF